MTENLLQKLEEKTMTILVELEKLRAELKQLKHENFSLKTEKENSTRKLQDLVSVLDSTFAAEPSVLSGDRLFLQEEAANAA
jgi:regulator of replication initiation timing